MGRVRTLVQFVKEEVIGSENTLLAWAVLAATAAIMGSSFYLNSPDASFQGIAGSRESNVNFEYPVEIRNVHVVPGQRVRKGDLLVELDQSALNAQLRQVYGELAKLKARRSSTTSAGALNLEFSGLEEERASLERQRSGLYVFAQIDGIVDAVNFKRGERAPAFSPIVTVSPESPSYVQGFVVEQAQTNLKPGSRVVVASLNHPGASVQGKVVGLGARIVEIPLRLAPNTHAGSSGLWGREVTVEIPSRNAMITGERVRISPLRPWLGSFLAEAKEESGKIESSPPPRPARVPPALRQKISFEASGALYLKDLKKYLVVSDDTDTLESPWPFLMSEDGEVDEQPLEIPGVGKVEDLESVSADQDYVYVMSSLIAKKSGELNPAKNLLVRFQREGRELSGAESAPLGRILRKLINESSNPLLIGLREEGLEKLEVEAQAVKDGALYLGLKAPSYPTRKSSLILRIPDVNALFEKSPSATLEVWKNPRFETSELRRQRISDFTFVNDQLYFLTSGKEEEGNFGGLWKIGEHDTEPRLLQTFAKHGPEGLAYNPEKNLFLITFDLGAEGSAFVTINGPRSSHGD